MLKLWDRYHPAYYAKAVYAFLLPTVTILGSDYLADIPIDRHEIVRALLLSFFGGVGVGAIPNTARPAPPVGPRHENGDLP